MKPLFNFVLPPFFALSVSAALWLVASIWLPKTPLFHIESPYLPTYFDVSLSPLFFKTDRAVPKQRGELLLLKNLTLKAIYRSKDGGFVIVEDGKKNVFIDLGKTYKGYKLIEITPTEAIFSDKKKRYKLEFKKAPSFSTNQEENIQTSYEETKRISKAILQSYKKDLSKIWQNIGFEKSPHGYRIRYIKPLSIFHNLGLRKGDIVLEVNGVPLKNDKEAWEIYKNIDAYDSIEITVLRNNERKVFHYALD